MLRMTPYLQIKQALEQLSDSIGTDISADICRALQLRYPDDTLTLDPRLLLHMEP